MKLPIGLSDFKEIREENYHYVDKSLFIQEILNRSSKVILLPRPRKAIALYRVKSFKFNELKKYP